MANDMVPAVPTSARPAPTADLREIVAALASAQKTSKGAPAYSRFVNRPFGRVLAALSFRAGLTPNSVTAISALFSFSAILVIALVAPAGWVGVLVGVCLVLGYAFDAADGQLARLRGGGTPAGEWLDHMVDAAKISCLHLAVLIGLFRFTDIAVTWLLVPVGFTVVAAVMYFGMMLNDSLRRQFTARTGVAVERGGTSGLRSLLVMPTDYGLLCVVFVLWGAPSIFFPVYVAIFVCNAGFMALASVKWFREMASLKG